MRISVITVSYNSASTIVDTVDSVLAQTGGDREKSYPDFAQWIEFVVYMGGFQKCPKVVDLVN